MGRRFTIEPNRSLSFGRTSKSDTVIEDNFMSGKHFGIQHLGDCAEVQDFGSKNKTLVNKQPVDQSRLNAGDLIRAGKTEFLVNWEEALPLTTDSSWKAAEEEPRYASPHPTPDQPPAVIGGFDQPNLSPISDSSRYVPPPRPQVVPVSTPAEAHRPINPFESSDAPPGEFVRPAIQPLSYQNSPISESSRISSSSVAKIQRLALAVNVEIHELIQKLNVNRYAHAHVVAHFRKIGSGLPDRLRAEPLFSQINDSRQYLPVIVSASDWLDRIDSKTTQRLANTDGLMVVLLDPSVSNEVQAIQELTYVGVPKYSDAGGFLGWCWPSQFVPMCAHMTQDNLSNFLGNWVSGFICPTPDQPTKAISYAKASLEKILSELGFN